MAVQQLAGSPPQASTRLWPGAAASALTGLLALVVYLRTLAPSLPTGDSGELITAAWVLGIAHPPGYPLYTLLGHLSTFLPFGSPALRVNTMSALLHAAAVGLTTCSIYYLLDGKKVADETGPLWAWGRALAATVGGLSLAFSTAFWSYSLVAEVFALNDLFAVLLFLLISQWRRQPERAIWFWGFSFVAGLASSNHHTIVLLAPALLLLLVGAARARLAHEAARNRLWRLARARLARESARNQLSRLGRDLLIGAGLFTLGLLPYAYLPVAASADPPLNWGDTRTVEGLVRHLTRADYGFARLVPQGGVEGSRLEHLGLLAGYLSGAFTPPGAVLAACGAWWLARNRPREGIAVTLAFLSTGPAFVAYANPYIDNRILLGVLQRFYILPSMFLAIGVGVGAFQLVHWVRHLSPPGAYAHAVPMSLVGLLAIPAWSVATRYGDLDQSSNLLDYHFGRDLLAALDPGSLLLAEGDAVITALYYTQMVESYRPDVGTLDIRQLERPAYVETIRRRHRDVAIPFSRYDRGRTSSLSSLVEANLPQRTVYLLGVPPRSDVAFYSRIDEQEAGFVKKLVRRGESEGKYAPLAEKLAVFQGFHYPTRTYPDTTWESEIVGWYGRVAFHVAVVHEDLGKELEAAEMYRRAIRLAPAGAASYGRLGLLLLRQGSPPSSVVPLLETYLQLNPEAPEADALRKRIELLRGRDR